MTSSSQQVKQGPSLHWTNSVLDHKWMFASALGQPRKPRHEVVQWLPGASVGAELGCLGLAAAQPAASHLPPKQWKFESFVC